VGVLRHNHLLLTSAPGRYALHDLVRAYAAGRASDEDPPPDRRAALTRLFDYYLAAAAAALDVMLPGDKDARPKIPPPSTPVPRFDAPDAGLRWLDAERPTLVAMAVHAADNGWPHYSALFSRQLFRYLLSSNSDGLTVHSHARDAARRTGDRLAEGAALRHLAVSLSQHGLFEPATSTGRPACWATSG
jgi:hypothetical protein